MTRILAILFSIFFVAVYIAASAWDLIFNPSALKRDNIETR